jgi:myo-inositol 2-dehydrogenase / D-chiro-inositol 1-dehydrogenase
VNRLRIGIVGAGYIAGRHAGYLVQLPEVDLVAVADPQLGRAEQLAARVGAQAVADADELVSHAELDALYVCVPPSAHGDLEVAALDRGLPLFVEKPLAVDVGTAERVAAAVAASGVTVATGYHWRYLDTLERALDLLRERPPRMLLGAWLDKAPGTGWWGQQRLSGGQTVEQATHLLDVARLLAGDVVTLHAEGARGEGGPGDILDVCTAAVRFDSGAVGSFSSTCVLRRGHRIGVEVFAPGLALTLTEEQLVVDDGSGPVVHEPEVDPMARQDRAFVDAVLGRGDDVRAPYAEALRTHRLAVAIATAAQASALEPAEA